MNLTTNSILRPLITASILTGGLASGAVIAITNPSFQDNVLAGGDGTFSTGVATGWTETGATIGFFNPNGGFYTTADSLDAGPTGGEVGDGDGNQALFFASNNPASVFQALTTNIVVGETYTLTVAVGDRDAGGRSGFAGYDISLFAGGTQLSNLQSSTSPGDGTFTDVSFTYTAQAGDSGPLGIQIGSFTPGGGLSVDFDNVRLTDTAAVPEPSSTILASLILAPLLLRRRRIS